MMSAMAVAEVQSPAAVAIEDYLRMGFDGPDREFVDGEIVERPMNDLPHANVQQNLAEIFGPVRRSQGLTCVGELRVRVTPSQIRIPDFIVFSDWQTERVPSAPPLLVVEVVSPSDTHSRMIGKLEEYRLWGAKHIWLIDPELRRLWVYRDQSLLLVDRLVLSELDISLTDTNVLDEPASA